MFDEEPDPPLHGECAAEIKSLRDRAERAETELASLRAELARLQSEVARDGAEVTRLRAELEAVMPLMCHAYDNLNDMPISEEWAAKWCADALPVIDAHIERKDSFALVLIDGEKA